MRIIDFIVCDDIRTEARNKNSLMGIYMNEIVFNFPAEEQWPLAMRLGIYARCQLEPEEAIPDNMELIINQSGQEPVTVKQKLSSFSLTPERLFAVSVTADGFPIYGPGELRFDLVFSHGEKTLVNSLSNPFTKIRLKVGTPDSASARR